MLQVHVFLHGLASGRGGPIVTVSPCLSGLDDKVQDKNMLVGCMLNNVDLRHVIANLLVGQSCKV